MAISESIWSFSANPELSCVESIVRWLVSRSRSSFPFLRRPSCHSFGRLFVGFHGPQHRKHCIPTARCRWGAEEFVDSAKISDCPHMPPVHTKYKAVSRPDDSYKPLLIS